MMQTGLFECLSPSDLTEGLRSKTYYLFGYSDTFIENPFSVLAHIIFSDNLTF